MSGKKCHFPFNYKGIKRNTCIREKNEGLWCSLTEDYDRDGQKSDCQSLYKFKDKINFLYFIFSLSSNVRWNE